MAWYASGHILSSCASQVTVLCSPLTIKDPYSTLMRSSQQVRCLACLGTPTWAHAWACQWCVHKWGCMQQPQVWSENVRGPPKNAQQEHLGPATRLFPDLCLHGRRGAFAFQGVPQCTPE